MTDKPRLTEKHYSGNGYYMLCSGVLRCDGKCCSCDELEKVVDRLGEYEDKAEQTVDAAEVVHGRWEEYPDSAHLRCTNCKMEFRRAKMSDTRNYCPNCGAKMDGKGEAMAGTNDLHLSACPVCGVPPHMGYCCGEHFIYGANPDCPYCGTAFTEMHTNEQEEIKAWNRRTAHGTE